MRSCCVCVSVHIFARSSDPNAPIKRSIEKVSEGNGLEQPGSDAADFRSVNGLVEN